MKERLKYIPTAIHLLVLICGTVLLPFAELGGVELSMLDVLKISFGKYNSLLARGVLALIKTYVRPYAYGMFVLLIAVIATMMLNGLLKERNAYIGGIIGQLVMNGIAVFLYLGIRSKLEGAKEMTEFFDLGDRIQYRLMPVLLWILLEVLALIMNVMGILMYRVVEEPVPEEIFQDEIPQNSGEYNGAIIGLTGIYASRAYELQRLERIYVYLDGRQIALQNEGAGNEILAQLYYIPEYQEYCVIPVWKSSIFLESGQPLECQRDYYLPRGTRIYVRDRQNMFQLA